jgi:hypothetical protein
MFNNDLSYLYSDEFFTSSILKKEELPKKVSKAVAYRPRISQKLTSTSSFRLRSKHIILFREDALKHFKRREKNRLAARQLIGKQQLLEEHLHNKIKQLNDEQEYLENNLPQLQAYKHDLEREINNIFSMNSLTESLSTKKEEIPLTFEHSGSSMTNILNFNHDMDDHLDN